MNVDSLIQESVGDNIDSLVTLDVRGYGVPRELYRAARELTDGPVILHAGRGIVERVRPDEAVLIGTGFVFPPWLTGELDGLVGSAVLARALERSLGAKPVLVLEPELVAPASQVLRTAGLQPTQEPDVWRQRPRQVLVQDFTREESAASLAAEQLLDDVNPRIVLSIERPGRNEAGVYHMGNGVPVTDLASKIDVIFERAAARGIYTVAIGDLGNELGMGKLGSTVRASVPYGAECGCPCGQGIAASVGADATIFASVSDWGAYGLAAVIAFLTGTSDAVPSGELERQLLRSAVAAGLIDGSGYAIPAVDGIGEDYNARLVEMLSFVIEQPLVTRERYQKMFEKVLDLKGRQT